VVIKREHIPDMEKYRQYQESYQTYLSLYENLKDTMHK